MTGNNDNKKTYVFEENRNIQNETKSENLTQKKKKSIKTRRHFQII